MGMAEHSSNPEDQADSSRFINLPPSSIVDDPSLLDGRVYDAGSSKNLKQRLLPIVTKIAHGATPFIFTFLAIHLTAPAMANLGGSSLASQVMILGREYYQTSFGEKYLVLTPLVIHGVSSLTKRYLTPVHLRRRLPNILSIAGYSAAFFFLPVHYLIHREYPTNPSPPIYAVGPSELDYEFVKVGLQTWPWRSWFLYAGLTLSVAWHAAAGIHIIWNTWLRPHLGAGATLKRRIITATSCVLPVLTGVYALSREPLMAFSSLASRYQAVFVTSFVYKP
ncbi:hypothetical protein K474DRAFT_1342909 [Panus rudis PR-1116 ss-1]|nr:hypothetical protein K474DRAFT_1342909 [Panus rudis PR-1116 ss-1]